MKERNSNIELLRIISMMMIVLSHYSVHNGINNYQLPFGINRLLLEISTLGNTGVIIFVLICGYFLIDNNSIKLKKLFLLIFQTFFYSSTIYLLFCYFGRESISIKSLLNNFFPITFKQYWFISAYILLYIFSPYLNKLLNSLTKKEFEIFINTSILIFCLFRTITMQDLNCNDFIELIIFYSIGAYIKKYKLNNWLITHNKLIFIVTLFILIFFSLFCDILQKYILNAGYFSTYLFSKHSIVNILFATSIFNYFIKKKSFSNKLINRISGCVLGIYLIHDNPYIRKILWSKICNVHEYIYKPTLLLHMLICVISIFSICCIIELLRKNTIEKILIWIYDKININIKKI